MKTFWVILLVAFLLFIIINAIRRRHYSNALYRARFLSRMPREHRSEPTPRGSIYMIPVILGAATNGAHSPASTPDCAPGVGDAGGSCGVGVDGGGAGS